MFNKLQCLANYTMYPCIPKPNGSESFPIHLDNLQLKQTTNNMGAFILVSFIDCIHSVHYFFPTKNLTQIDRHWTNSLK